MLWLNALILSVLTGLDTRMGARVGAHHAPERPDRPHTGFTRVVRNQLAPGGGSGAVGRKSFGSYGGVDADSMEAGSADGWAGSKFA